MSRALFPLRRAASTLRIAGKQLRRDRRKVRLIVALVALPSTVLMTVGTVYASQNPTRAELVANEVGQSQAWIKVSEPDGTAVNQDPYTAQWQGTLEPVPDDSSYDDNPSYADVPSLLPVGTLTLALDESTAIVGAGDLVARLGSIVGEAWDPALAGRFHVESGIVPTGPGQVMLSPDAANRLNAHVGDTLSVGRPAHDVKLVGVLGGGNAYWSGTVYGFADDLGPVDDLGAVDDTGAVGEPFSRTWYLPNTPVTRAQQDDLNAHGLLVFSREVTEEGRPSGPVGSGMSVITNAFGNSGITGTVGIGAFEMLLLAGAGFMVTMRSNQRNLALLGATGAPRGTLVSVGVATGAWLGLLGGVVGVPLGLAAAWGWIWLQTRSGGSGGDGGIWGYHVVPEYIVGTVVFAVVVGALASLIPALVAARVDIVASLRGSQRPARPRAWPTIVGAALAAASAALFVWAARMYEHSWEISRENSYDEGQRATLIAVIALIVGLVGASFAAPLALRALARALSPLGVAARIAARDASRHAFRTVPVVAAIAITVALATLGAVSADHESRLNTEELSAPYGDGQVRLDSSDGEKTVYIDAAQVQDAITSAVPDAQAVAVSTLQGENGVSPDGDGAAGAAMVATLDMPKANICPEWLSNRSVMTEKEYAADDRCGRSDTVGVYASGIAVGGVEQLAAIVGREPTAAEATALSDGGAVVFGDLYVEDGTATFDVWDYGKGNFPDAANAPDKTFTLDAVVSDSTALSGRGFSAIVSPEVAAQMGATVEPSQVLVHVDGGLSQEQQDAIQGSLFRVADLWISVSRAPDNYALYIALLSLGAVLIIGGACTAIAVGLARQEAARDDATLASLGASPALAKSVAAWQAGIVVGLAGVIGVALGSAVASVTMRDVATGRLEAPWLLMALALVAVPTLVAGVSWLFTRAPKVIHYRLAA
ncbi:FtsX-like permease family protein [Demequina sp.]|uniref:FtsX-like permease family protein n=1 Tax=Demequina sp. TaxID=2050685 RepID=UPI0025C6C36F|nr:FtsX-like permease family protein [Demequina sp.]